MSEKKYREVYITDASQLRPGMRYRALAGENWYQIHESQLAPSLLGFIELSLLEFQEPIEDAQEEGWERLDLGSPVSLDPDIECAVKVGNEFWKISGAYALPWPGCEFLLDPLIKAGCEVWRKVEPKEEPGPLRFERKAAIVYIRTLVPWIECPVDAAGKTFECIEVKPGFSVVVCKGEPVYVGAFSFKNKTPFVFPDEWEGQRLAVCLVGKKP